MKKRPTSAYIHIPFCTQICYYCDFSKVFIKNQPVDEYLAALPDFITLFFHDPVQSLDRIGFFKYFFIFYLCCMLLYV
ncbi:hypothetical protein Q7V73_10525, partial [Streptococcus suis]|nr:hypothetical protein [Streptococcus suis]